MTKQITGKALYLDPVLILAMRERKEPYESWNGFLARECGITKKDLVRILETKEGMEAAVKVDNKRERERVKRGKPPQPTMKGKERTYTVILKQPEEPKGVEGDDVPLPVCQHPLYQY